MYKENTERRDSSHSFAVRKNPSHALSLSRKNRSRSKDPQCVSGPGTQHNICGEPVDLILDLT